MDQKRRGAVRCGAATPEMKRHGWRIRFIFGDDAEASRTKTAGGVYRVEFVYVLDEVRRAGGLANRISINQYKLNETYLVYTWYNIQHQTNFTEYNIKQKQDKTFETKRSDRCTHPTNCIACTKNNVYLT